MKRPKHSINNIGFLYNFASFTYKFKGLILILTKIIYKVRRKKLILVFGNSRSGTTMIGEFISLGKNSKYVHEPVKQVLRYYHNNKKRQDEFWEFSRSSKATKMMDHILLCIALYYGFTTKQNNICIKEVSIVNKFLNIYANINFAQYIYIIRHPCGYIDSLIRQRKEENIEPFSIKQIKNIAESWSKNIIENKIFEQKENLALVLFEDITKNPMEGFKNLYNRFGLIWTKKIESEIKSSTTSTDGSFYQTKRNSKIQADKWKKTLSNEIIETIREGCKKYPTNIYEGF